MAAWRLTFSTVLLMIFVGLLPAQNTVQYVTAGGSGVSTNQLVIESGTSGQFVPAASSLGCGDGFALSGASAANNSFPMATGAATIQTAIADGSVTAGNLVTVSSTAGEVTDTSQSSRSSISPSTCIVGVALTGYSGTPPALITILYDGPGSYGSQYPLATTLGGTGANLTGTQGGIPWFSTSSTMGTSSLLTQYGVLYGGGSGNPPAATSAPTAGTILAGSASAPSFTATPTLGSNGVTTGQLLLANGNASGNTVTIQNAAATGAYNFNLPAAVTGTSGYFLTSGGGGSNPMTWTQIVPSANGGTGVSNTATLTLGTSNQNWATLATGIVKNTITTGALSNAGVSDVTGLFSTCTGTQYLGYDGTCHTAIVEPFSVVINSSPVDAICAEANDTTAHQPTCNNGSGGNSGNTAGGLAFNTQLTIPMSYFASGKTLRWIVQFEEFSSSGTIDSWALSLVSTTTALGTGAVACSGGVNLQTLYTSGAAMAGSALLGATVTASFDLVATGTASAVVTAMPALLGGSATTYRNTVVTGSPLYGAAVSLNSASNPQYLAICAQSGGAHAGNVLWLHTSRTESVN